MVAHFLGASVAPNEVVDSSGISSSLGGLVFWGLNQSLFCRWIPVVLGGFWWFHGFLAHDCMDWLGGF